MPMGRSMLGLRVSSAAEATASKPTYLGCKERRKGKEERGGEGRERERKREERERERGGRGRERERESMREESDVC